MQFQRGLVEFNDEKNIAITAKCTTYVSGQLCHRDTLPNMLAKDTYSSCPPGGEPHVTGPGSMMSPVHVLRSDLHGLIGLGCDVFVWRVCAPNADPPLQSVNPIERCYIFRETLNVKSS